MSDSPLRVGIFGGTFDPIHSGHVRAALAFREECALDVVYVIPNCVPNMKTHAPASPADRLEMAKLAFAEHPGFTVSDIELRRGGVSYTVDTAEELLRMHPGCELFLYFGDDRLDHFEHWHAFDRLKQLVTVALADRTGRDMHEKIAYLQNEKGVRFVFLTFDAIRASSTACREGDFSLCPEQVQRYIARKGLYV